MKNIKDFQERYNRWKKGERYWDIRGIDLPRYDDADKDTEPQIQIPYNVDNSVYTAGTLPEVDIVAENKFVVTPTDLPDIYRTTNGDFVHVDKGNSEGALSFVNPYNNHRVYTLAMLDENARANKRYENFEKDRDLAQSMGLDPTLPFIDLYNGQYKKAFNDSMNTLAWFGGVGGALARGYVGTRNMFSDNGISKTIDLFNNGQYGRGALSALGDGFNALLMKPVVGKSIGIGKQILIPSNRAAHAYYAVAPIGYDSMLQKAQQWVKSMMTGKYPDIENPLWQNSPGFNSIEYFINPSTQNAFNLAKLSRIDAWRIYNGLPLKYNMFIKNADGSYYYDLNKINEITDKTAAPFYPGESIDYLGGAGGHVSLRNIFSKQYAPNPTNHTATSNGIDVMEDLWDLQPFRGNENSFANRITNAYAANVVPKIQNIRDILYKKGIIGFGAKYPFAKYINRLENATLNHFRYTIPFKNSIYKISDKLNDFEVGTISGGKPFQIRTVVPYNIEHELLSTGGFSPTKGVLGFSGEHVAPVKLKDLNDLSRNYTQVLKLLGVSP